MSLEERADLNTCFWLQYFVFYHTDSTGMCATKRLHGRKLLLHFAPAEFQRKALGKPKGKCGEKSDESVCISHLSHTRAGAMPVTWNGLLGLGSSYPAHPNLGVHTPQARWGRALSPLGSPSGCCSFCPHPPCCSPGVVLVGAAVRRDDPYWRDSELWHQSLAPGQGSAWPRLRTCLGRTLGQPCCLILMGIACTGAWRPQPCRSFSHVLGQIGFLVTPSKAQLGRQS